MAGGAGALARPHADAASHRADLFGLALDGVYAARAADGSLDCSASDQSLRVAISGEPDLHWPNGLRTGIAVTGRGVPGPSHVYDAPGGWVQVAGEGDERPGLSARLTRVWTQTAAALHPGEGVIALRLEPDGDVTVLDFHWQWRSRAEDIVRPRARVPGHVYAGGRMGPVRLGHCPAAQ